MSLLNDCLPPRRLVAIDYDSDNACVQLKGNYVIVRAGWVNRLGSITHNVGFVSAMPME